MSAAWLKKRQTKYGAYLGVYVLVVLAILGAANYLANRYNKTVDTTSNKIFSLSDQTRKIVANLKQDVKIYYFDQTARMNESRFGPSAKDLLDRYDNLSPKVTVEFVDPVKNPKRALDMKVQAAGTTIVEVGARREEAKTLSEEQVTNALIRALKTEKRTACFLEGHGEHDVESTDAGGFSGAKESLEGSNVTTKGISLLEKEPKVPADCTTLVIGGPRTELVEAVEIAVIKKFIQDGGRAMILVDPPTKNVGTTNLVKLLADLGVKVNNDLVVDLSGIGQLFGADALSPLVAKYESHAITKEMRNVASLFPLARSVEPGDSKDKITVEKLFSTTPRSYGVSDLSAREIKVDPKKDKPGPLTLAVAGTVRGEKEGQQGRFVVVGSSNFATNSALGFGGNRDLFLNMMSWLSSDEDLISIRPKDPEDRRLTLSASQMRTIFYTSMITLPLLIIVSGTYVWWRRR